MRQPRIIILAAIGFLATHAPAKAAAGSVREATCRQADHKFYAAAFGWGYVKDISPDRIATIDIFNFMHDSDDGFSFSPLRHADNRTARIMIPSEYGLEAAPNGGALSATVHYSDGGSRRISADNWVSFDMWISCDEPALTDVILSKPRWSVVFHSQGELRPKPDARDRN